MAKIYQEKKIEDLKVRASNSESLIQAKNLSENLVRIFEMCTDPNEFRTIWKALPATTKAYFIQNTMKYVAKEKGKEVDVPQQKENDDTAKLVRTAMEVLMDKAKK